MQQVAVIQAAAYFIDRKGRVAQASWHLPITLTPEEAASRALYILSKALGVSNGLVMRLKLTWQWREEQPQVADPASDVQTRVALYYRNEDGPEAQFIPSPRPDLFEQTGPYAGIRVDVANPDVALVLSAFGDALASTLTPEGDPFPTVYSVGGLAL
jgi:hypothetical protein